MEILAKYRVMLAFIDSKVDGLSFPSSERKIIAAALYDVANDHGKGICTLLEKQLDVSAFALMRIQFETFIRAAWLLSCATDDEVSLFMEKDEIKLESNERFYFGDMVKAVELAKEWPGKLSEIKEFSWKALNSYTHGGQHQVTRRFDGHTIEAHHDVGQIEETAKFSAVLSFLGFCEMIEITENEANGAYAQELSDQISGWVF